MQKSWLGQFRSDLTSNRLLKQSGSNAKTYTLDASGNQTGDGSITLTYDNAGRPRVALKNGQSVSGFFYNAQGQLAIKTASSKPIQFVYDEAGHLLAEHADPATQSPTQDHSWLGDTPIAVVRPSSADPSKPLIYHVYADHLNTPRAIYDAFNKRLTWRWESEAFGNTLPDQDADKNGSQFVYNLRFPGQYWDNGIKLSHNWYRTYNPETGRYVQSDPIGLQGGLNTYGYVDGRPLGYVDPKGLWGTLVVGTGIRVIGGRAASAAIGAGLRRGIGGTAGRVAACLLIGSCSMTEAEDESTGTSEGQVCEDGSEVEGWKIPQEARNKIPPEWGDGEPNRKKDGTRWHNPENPKGQGVRIDKGDPNSKLPSQQEDHVIVRDKQVIGRDGKPISGSIK
ncbi:RHS repeat-associated core domain-containing protein, partial [Chitinivorax sp. B]|uniref:RHS repeat domain-containing protein n=1 Tax=Chitinivorax sp. B TaxID=2502235 RepID=UPI0010F7028B